MGPPYPFLFLPFPGEVLSTGRGLGVSLLSASSFVCVCVGGIIHRVEEDGYTYRI